MCSRMICYKRNSWWKKRENKFYKCHGQKNWLDLAGLTCAPMAGDVTGPLLGSFLKIQNPYWSVRFQPNRVEPVHKNRPFSTFLFFVTQVRDKVVGDYSVITYILCKYDLLDINGLIRFSLQSS